MNANQAMPQAMLNRCPEQSTQRNATDERNARLQDTHKNHSVPNAPTPVDNRHSSLHADIERLHSEHKSARQIATELGCSERTIVRWRQRNGKSLGPRWEVKTSERARTAELIAEGCSTEEAARTVGVPGKTVRKWFPDAPRMSRQEVGSWRALLARHSGMWNSVSEQK